MDVLAQGANLDRGVTQATDYTVKLGDDRCIPNGQLHSNMFKCDPPRSAPSTASVDQTRCNDSYAVMVSSELLRLDSIREFVTFEMIYFSLGLTSQTSGSFCFYLLNGFLPRDAMLARY